MIKYVFSAFYLALLQIRYFLYKYNFIKTHQFNIPIISIGNIELGGSGKTPMVVFLSKRLSSLNIKHVVVSRGYKKQKRGLIIVSDYDAIRNFSPIACGDEPILLAEKLPGIPVIVSENKAVAVGSQHCL